MAIEPEQVDDLVQEVMLKVYENIDRYNMKYAVSTWLYTIARNHCLDKLREKKTRARHMLSDSQLEVVSTYPTPEEELLAAERSRTLKSLIETLSAMDQHIVFLRFYEECSYRQMASILDMPVGTIKYRVHAIRKKLKTRREKYEYVPFEKTDPRLL
jgi:RNA polymerase sigma-70 factor (ECF subfamily)